jgi:hypothetical protein
MALSLQTISNLEGFLLSKRVTVGGDEVLVFASMISELQAEKQRLLLTARIVPTSVLEKKIEDANPPKIQGG